MNFVFVCTGNTCRSPVAEGFMKKLFDKNSDNHSAFSRGVSVSEGSVVSGNSVSACREYGVDIKNHVPSQLTADDIEKADYIIAMTDRHRDFVSMMYPGCREKIFSVSDFCGYEISDPYGGNMEIYRLCAKQINDAVQIIYRNLVDKCADNL